MKSLTPLVTDLMGSKLRTPEGEEIGVVQNMMLNPSDGTVIFIFLCYGNFIGKVHRHFAISRRQLTFKQDGGAFYFEIDERRLSNALQFTVAGSSGHAFSEGLDYMYEIYSDEETYKPQVLG